MNDRREQPPSSPAFSLIGMERPVRSFKSFISTAPPHLRPHDCKPLPPTPIYGESIFALSSPSIPFLSDTSWKAPAAWDDQKLQASPHLTTRRYDPLIPEPLPGIFDRQKPSDMCPSQRSHLESINELAKDVPSLPPRNPRRTSLFHIPSAESDPGVPISSPNFNFSDGPPIVGTPMSCPEPSLDADMRMTSPQQQSNVDLRISNLSTKQKAFASLGIDSPSDQHVPWGHWSGGSGSPQARDHIYPHLSMRGTKLQPLNRGDSMLDDELEETDMSEKMQQLSVSQDYHNVLADQYHEAHVYISEQQMQAEFKSEGSIDIQGTAIKPPPKNHELIPRPLSWKKENGGSSPGSVTFNTRSDVTPPPESSKRHRKLPSWMPLPQLTHGQKRPRPNDDICSRSASDTAVPVRKQIPFGLGRSSKKEIHLSDVIPHVRGFISNSKRGKDSNDEIPPSSSPSIPFQQTLPSRSPPLEQPTRLLRLPRGLTLAREQESIPRSHTTSFLDLSPTLERPRPISDIDFPDFDTFSTDWRRSSVYSQYTQGSVTPAMAVNKRLRTSVASLPSARSGSTTSTSATSPLAREIVYPRTPPPLPPHAPRAPNSLAPQSPLSYKSDEQFFDNRVDSAVDDSSFKRGLHVGILDKARDAREAWRRRQRDVKHEKLKSSIRVLGPTDPTVAAGYVRREGKGSVDVGVVGSRVPGYMATGAL